MKQIVEKTRSIRNGWLKQAYNNLPEVFPDLRNNPQEAANILLDSQRFAVADTFYTLEVILARSSLARLSLTNCRNSRCNPHFSLVVGCQSLYI